MKKNEGISLDDLDAANMDLDFIKALNNMLFNISSDGGIDRIKSGTIASMCSVCVEKIEGIERFISKVTAIKQTSKAA